VSRRPGSSELRASGSAPDLACKEPAKDGLAFDEFDGEHGRGLWRSDGTADGTILLQDVASGLASSAPQGLTQVGDVVYFQATDDAGPQLWALPVDRTPSTAPRSGGQRKSPRGD